VRFEPLAAMTAEAYEFGLQDKLMGQVNLVLIGRAFLVAGGSFTLTSGILDHEPVRLGSSASMVNGAVNAFVRAAALEMPNGQRINAVCPGVVQEALATHGAFFRGFEPVPAARVALAYARSVEGGQNGQVYRVQ
jgi:NAD(P)-dependent dehydrogenase (short-subunit alcohol dehydrogenase family)